MSNLLDLWFIIVFLVVSVICYAEHPIQPKKHTAMFVFGDSVLDPGNSNYLNISVETKANRWPYGETFFKLPTGRFCDGRIIPDFMAMDIKLPLSKPYLDPAKQQFTNGTNFAAAAARAIAETNPGWINFKQQLSFFRKVAYQLKEELGEEEAKKILIESIYLSSIGGDDYNYFISEYPNSTELEKEQYVKLVIGKITDGTKEIFKMGGRKFVFQNVGPMGCLPLAKQANGLHGDECLEELLQIIKLHNNALLKAVQVLEIQLQGFKYSVFDYYTGLYNIIKHYSTYGFKVADVACCGYGTYRAVHCGIEPYELCSNPNEYVFFDGSHPGERANVLLGQLLWNGEPTITIPRNFKQLFELDIASNFSSENLVRNATEYDRVADM